MIRSVLILFLLFAATTSAHAVTLGDLRLRPTTALLASQDDGLHFRQRPFGQWRPSLFVPGAGSGSDLVSFLGGAGYLVVGTATNFLIILPTLAFAAQTENAFAGGAVLLAGVALWAVVAKGETWLFGIDRSWESAFAGAGLGLATGVLLGVALSFTVDDGLGFNKLAAAITGVIFGGAIAAPVWTLIDPFELTPMSTPATEDAFARRDGLMKRGLTLPLASMSF